MQHTTRPDPARGALQHGYEVGRYMSLERLIEESREDYYAALHQSSQNWHTGQHDLLPWLNYFLAIVRRAYREFEARALVSAVTWYAACYEISRKPGKLCV